MSDPDSTILVQLHAQPTLSIRGEVPIAHLGASHGARLRALHDHVHSHQLEVAGPPYVRYHTFGETVTDVEVGVPLRQDAPGAGAIQAGHLPGGPAFVTEHDGPHVQLGRAYGRVRDALSAMNRAPEGAAWEVYEWIDLAAHDTDRTTWADATQGRTRLVQPVREGA